MTSPGVTYAPPAAWRTIREDPRILLPQQSTWIRATPQQVAEAPKCGVPVTYKRSKQVPL
jgi:hypothetical protein